MQIYVHVKIAMPSGNIVVQQALWQPSIICSPYKDHYGPHNRIPKVFRTFLIHQLDFITDHVLNNSDNHSLIFLLQIGHSDPEQLDCSAFHNSESSFFLNQPKVSMGIWWPNYYLWLLRFLIFFFLELEDWEDWDLTELPLNSQVDSWLF